MTAISTAEPTRRGVVVGLATVAVGCGAPALARDALTPEMFGARGDGRTNDTGAFRRLADAVTRRGGGRIVLRRATYIVGEQRSALGSGEGWAYVPSPILSFSDLPGPLTIDGGGATLRCASGLRYGSFEPRTGRPHRHAVPFIDPSVKATPYAYMIFVERCAGSLTITDLELDGDLASMQIGGDYGDVGIQIEGTGIFLRNNRGDEIIRNVHSHQHPQDGLMIDGLDEAALASRTTRLVENVRCEFNNRQGCSLIGGRGWQFSRSSFSHTGRAGKGSPPAAGFDIEAEGGKTNRDHVFTDCQFVDNAGCGLVADSGDSEGATFTRCRFVGTTIWSIWPCKPRFQFVDCVIVGSAARPFGDPDPHRATQFTRCLFTDDPKLSPTGVVYRGGRADGPMFDLSNAQNILFNRCRFAAVGGATLPWSTRAIYRDSNLQQRTKSPGYPRGTFLGRNVIDGTVDLYGSKIRGELMLNGRPATPSG